MKRVDEWTITREQRGESAFWVHVYGGAHFDERKADRAAADEARAWARELGVARNPLAVSSGGQYGRDAFRHSVCFSFRPVSEVKA